MKEFNATKFSEDAIELKSSKDLLDVYKVIKEEENFMLKWVEGKQMMSKLIIANSILAKVENGEVEIFAKEAI